MRPSSLPDHDTAVIFNPLFLHLRVFDLKVPGLDLGDAIVATFAPGAVTLFFFVSSSSGLVVAAK